MLDGISCFKTNQVILQPGNYFGVSASTGDMPDHHQLFSFKITPLDNTTEDTPPVTQLGNFLPQVDNPVHPLENRF